MPGFLIFAVYIGSLYSEAVISLTLVIGYLMLAAAIWLTVAFGITEVASNFKIKEPAFARFERFLSRSLLISGLIASFYVMIILFSDMLSSDLSIREIVPVALLFWALLIAALARNQRIQRFINKRTMDQ